MARVEREVSTLVINPETPQQRAVRVVPTVLLPMYADRAVTLARRQHPDAPMAWLHCDTLMQTTRLEAVT